MTISHIMKKMIAYSEGNRHDISHFMQVWAYAKTIGELESLDAETQFILEAAAIVHDIACPLCRAKYGNTDGKYQEAEGAGLTAEFFADSDLSPEKISRVVYLVSHHHTLKNIDGTDYQILIEADYIVNAMENGWTGENVRNFLDNVARTDSGRAMIRSVFRL